jgi:predicted GH43/DUF377 family glycosyl hydrolase
VQVVVASLNLPRSPGAVEAARLRLYETRDMARRAGTISPDRLFINGFPARNPIAAFNPGMIVEGEAALVYPRIIIGYYKYVSAIVETRVPLEDILSGQVSLNVYSSNLAIMPSTEHDLWGAEDPRAYNLAGRPAITYTGRTISYFEPGYGDRTLALTAVNAGGRWVKAVAHRPSPSLRGFIVNDKNAFLLNVDDKLYFFHRPQLRTGEYILVASELPSSAWEALSNPANGPVEVESSRDWLVMDAAPFEEKIAWATPPLHVRGRTFLFLLHGVGRRLQAYRVFAAEIELSPSEGPIVRAVTPYYIMGPREAYEVYGDRPYTVFPCGAARIDDELLLSYGAADYMVAFALLDYTELLSALDRGRIY